MKKCTRCGELKDTSLYYKHSGHWDELDTMCISCSKVAKAKWRENNRDKHNETSRNYNKRTYVPRPRILLTAEEVLKRNNESKSRWSRRNPNSHRAAQQKRMATKRQLVNDFTEKEWQAVLLSFSHACAYCGVGGNLEQDHVVSVVQGGGYTIGNIVPACRSCNASKSDKEVRDWIGCENNYESLVTSMGDAEYILKMEI